MAVSYNRLWKLLVDRKMSKADLRKQAAIASNTMTKLRRDKEVTLEVLGKICKTLDVDYGDIMPAPHTAAPPLLSPDSVPGSLLPAA